MEPEFPPGIPHEPKTEPAGDMIPLIVSVLLPRQIFCGGVLHCSVGLGFTVIVAELVMFLLIHPLLSIKESIDIISVAFGLTTKEQGLLVISLIKSPFEKKIVQGLPDPNRLTRIEDSSPEQMASLSLVGIDAVGKLRSKRDATLV
jgi:hypothetical protein